MKYTIKHGSIAAIQHIKTPDDKQLNAIYMGQTRLPEVYIDGDMSQDIWETLPLPVKASINRQFGAVFSLPYNSREGFIKSSMSFEVEA